MTIVDSLKAKGSTGGNNIAEAIKNLPMGGGGDVFIIRQYHNSETNEYSYISDTVFNPEENSYVDYRLIRDGDNALLAHLQYNGGMHRFCRFRCDPISNPSLVCDLITPDNEDPTHRKYNCAGYAANVSFFIDD